MRGKSIVLSVFLASGLIGTSGTVFGQAAGGTIRSNQEHSQPVLTDEYKAAVNNAPVPSTAPATGVVPRAVVPVQPRVVQPVRRYAWQYVWPGYWFWLPVVPSTSVQPVAPSTGVRPVAPSTGVRPVAPGVRVQPAPTSPTPTPAPAPR